MPEARSRRIGITACDGISSLELARHVEAFRVNFTFDGRSPVDSLGTHECSVVSMRGGPVNTATAWCWYALSAHLEQDAATLIVPGAVLRRTM